MSSTRDKKITSVKRVCIVDNVNAPRPRGSTAVLCAMRQSWSYPSENKKRNIINSKGRFGFHDDLKQRGQQKLNHWLLLSENTSAAASKFSF